MTLQECYTAMGGDYADVLSRLRTDERIARFLVKILDDNSFELLESALAAGNTQEAFRAAHTIKGICLNLSLSRLFRSASALTEALRGRTEYDTDIVPLFNELKSDYALTMEAIRKLQ